MKEIYPKALSTVASEGTGSLVRSHKDSERRSVKNYFQAYLDETFLENASKRSTHVYDREGGVVRINHTVVWCVWIPASKNTPAR